MSFWFEILMRHHCENFTFLSAWDSKRLVPLSCTNAPAAPRWGRTARSTEWRTPCCREARPKEAAIDICQSHRRMARYRRRSPTLILWCFRSDLPYLWGSSRRLISSSFWRMSKIDTLGLHLASQVEKRKKEKKRSPFYQLEVTQT